MAKFKAKSIKPPSQPINPDIARQTQTGNDTAKKIGGWLVTGQVIKSGGMTLDSSKPYILMNDGSNDRLLIGEDGT